MPFLSDKWNIMKNLDMLLERYKTLLLGVELKFCKTCCQEIQTVTSTLPDFQGIKLCVKYLDSHLHKTIFYCYNSYYVSNAIRLKWSGS